MALIEARVPGTFEITVDTAGSLLTVVAHGYIDEAGSDLLRDVLRALVVLGKPEVRVDLADVVEVHPAAVRMLVHLRQVDLRVTCVHPSPAVTRALQTTGAALILGLSPA
jgi:anti-anti-sigma regulatory factor